MNASYKTSYTAHMQANWMKAINCCIMFCVQTSCSYLLFFPSCENHYLEKWKHSSLHNNNVRSVTKNTNYLNLCQILKGRPKEKKTSVQKQKENILLTKEFHFFSSFRCKKKRKQKYVDGTQWTVSLWLATDQCLVITMRLIHCNFLLNFV